MLLKKFFFLFLLIASFSLEAFIKSENISPVLFQVIFNKNIELRKSAPDTINLLLLGIGGGNHDCPNCSDTVIFTSLNIVDKKITLVSLPRDIWSYDIGQKINAAYEIGQAKRKGGGLILAKSVIGKITGQEIDYGVVIDFSGFIKAVDLLGGLDVNIERTFDDYEYPIEGKENDPCGHKQEELDALATASSQLEVFPCRYEHVHFDKGQTHMDGKTALEFVRSRHAKGDEGTDFARSKRQEKVIKAFMDKVFSLQIIVNPAKIIGLYDTLKNSIDTDIQKNEFDDFIKLAERFRGAKTKSVVIDYGDAKTKRGGLLTNPPISQEYNYAWTLIPRAGKNNFSEIQEYIRCNLIRDDCIVSQIP